MNVYNVIISVLTSKGFKILKWKFLHCDSIKMLYVIQNQDLLNAFNL